MAASRMVRAVTERTGLVSDQVVGSRESSRQRSCSPGTKRSAMRCGPGQRMSSTSASGCAWPRPIDRDISPRIATGDRAVLCGHRAKARSRSSPVRAAGRIWANQCGISRAGLHWRSLGPLGDERGVQQNLHSISQTSNHALTETGSALAA